MGIWRFYWTNYMEIRLQLWASKTALEATGSPESAGKGPGSREVEHLLLSLIFEKWSGAQQIPLLFLFFFFFLLEFLSLELLTNFLGYNNISSH